MSKEEQGAVFLSIIERREAAIRKLVALKDKAQSLGKEYERLGRLLLQDPGLVCFEDCKPLPGRGVHGFTPAQFRIGELVLVIQEIHQTETEIDDCTRKLKDARLAE